jgi:hypothetical protein
MKTANWKTAIALALGVLATHTAAAADGYDIQRDVQDFLEQGDCAGVLKRVNEGLAKKMPPVQLLAGALLEHGVCFKADWDKAVELYTMASKGGESAAAYRLAAGFAAPDHGPDVAAAMWWLQHTDHRTPIKQCEVPEDARDDPERFVALLKSWPQDKLLRCNYAVGLVSTVAGEIKYPSRGLTYAVGGTYVLRFMPGQGRIEMKSGRMKEFALLSGVFDGHVLQERKSTSMQAGFVENLTQVSRRALERYPRPQGIDPAWQFDIAFVFNVVD